MKTILILIATLFNTIFTSGQNQVIDIRDKNGSPATNAYYKDVNNLLDTYQGTYIYNNGNIVLKIILLKKINQYNGRFYEDLIIGEYEYSENNVILISTISDIKTTYGNQRRHKISGNSLITKTNKPNCNECNTNELRLRLGFLDATRELYGSLIARKVMHYNQKAIKVNLYMETNTIYFEGQPTPPDDFTVPSGEYLLIKQP